jgi:hypothetical protein
MHAFYQAVETLWCSFDDDIIEDKADWSIFRMFPEESGDLRERIWERPAH